MNPRLARYRNAFDAAVRLILPRFCALVLAMCLATPLMAAETLKILIGFPAGSGLDVITRTIAERVRIDTRAPSSSTIAAAAAVVLRRKRSPSRSPTAIPCWPRPS
jgi:hypothetical protein